MPQAPAAAEPSARRWPRLQYSLRALLASILFVSLFFGSFAIEDRRYREQRRVGAQLEGLGAMVVTEPRGPHWMRALVGERRFRAVTFVVLFGSDAGPQTIPDLAELVELSYLDLSHLDVGDDDLIHLRNLNRLRVLYLSHTDVTDEGLEHLRSMPALVELDLTGCDVSDEAVEKLRQALPQLDVDR